jgi:hypothetical protein
MEISLLTKGEETINHQIVLTPSLEALILSPKNFS